MATVTVTSGNLTYSNGLYHVSPLACSAFWIRKQQTLILITTCCNAMVGLKEYVQQLCTRLTTSPTALWAALAHWEF